MPALSLGMQQSKCHVALPGACTSPTTLICARTARACIIPLVQVTAVVITSGGGMTNASIYIGSNSSSVQANALVAVSGAGAGAGSSSAWLESSCTLVGWERAVQLLLSLLFPTHHPPYLPACRAASTSPLAARWLCLWQGHVAGTSLPGQAWPMR